MRTSRIVAFCVLALAATYTEISLISTWCVHIARVPDDLPHYTSFTSVWTFFWPCSIAILLVLAGAVNWLGDQPISKARAWFVLAYFVTALYFLFLVHRTMWFAYDPSHSGPAL